MSSFITFGYSFAGVENKNVPKKNSKPAAWTETLSLQDFFLSPEYVELTENKKLKEYKTTIAKLYNQDSSVFSTATTYGLLLIDLGELEKARLVWDKAVKDFHANDTPKVYRAWVSARLGNYKEAKEVWVPIIKQKVDKGIAGFSAGIWSIHQVDALLGLYLINDYLPENEREEISKIITSVIRIFPQDPKFATILVNEYLKSGQVEKAAQALVSVLSNNPNEPVLITLLGVAQLITHHYDEALKVFDTAKEINPNILTTHIMRARTLFVLNREKESFEELDEAMRLNPDLNIAENKKKKYLAPKSYMISKKLKKEESKEVKEPKDLNPEDLNKAFVPQN